MRLTFCLLPLSVLAAVLGGHTPLPAQDSTSIAAVAQASESSPADVDGAAENDGLAADDRSAIEAAIASYVAAFNRADAKGLAAHWSPQGQIITSHGESIRGRDSLEQDFAEYFQNNQSAQIELMNPTLAALSPSVVVETGVARVLVPDQVPSETDYEAIHVRTDEGWKIDSVRESDRQAPPPSNYDKLQDLEWMVGRWIDHDENMSIETIGRWTTNQNFLVRSFKVWTPNGIDFAGTQIVGWDPNSQLIRSWMFDSDGGFGVGRWSRSDNRWTVQTLNVLPDGRRASATNIYELINENTLRYQSIGRQVDGDLLPNIEPVMVSRVADE